MSNAPKIKTGEKFGLLTIVGIFDKGGPRKHRILNCICDCGGKRTARSSWLRAAKNPSCGCDLSDKLKKAATTHGMSRSREYKSWGSMLARCYNKSNNRFYLYGERGIIVCDRWKKFLNFYVDMGERPVGKTLGRINNNKGYCKNNCKWATPKEQANNRRNTICRD